MQPRKQDVVETNEYAIQITMLTGAKEGAFEEERARFTGIDDNGGTCYTIPQPQNRREK